MESFVKAVEVVELVKLLMLLFAYFSSIRPTDEAGDVWYGRVARTKYAFATSADKLRTVKFTD
jgi:hypothetical protein